MLDCYIPLFIYKHWKEMTRHLAQLSLKTTKSKLAIELSHGHVISCFQACGNVRLEYYHPPFDLFT